MRRLKIVIFFVIINYSNANCQEYYWPIINHTIFNSDSVKKKKFKAVEIIETGGMDTSEGILHRSVYYFDQEGKVNYLQEFKGDKLEDCYSNAEIICRPYWIKAEKSLWTFSSDHIQEVGEPDNCLIEVYKGRIKQTYFENGLPITINHFIAAYYEPRLINYSFTYIKDIEYPKQCISKAQLTQLKQDSILWADSNWPKDFLKSTYFSDSLSSRQYLNKAKTFWELLVSKEINSSFYIVKSWEFSSAYGEIMPVHVIGPECPKAFHNFMNFCQDYCITNIVLISIKDKTEFILNGKILKILK